MSWKEFLKEKRNSVELIISLFLLVVMLTSLANFVNPCEKPAQGVALPDPVLSLFQPIDLTWFTFALIYISLIVAIVALSKNPKQLVFAIQLYSLMAVVRIAAMYLLPLEPIARDDHFKRSFC
ncbi:MAG: hypothetical protein MZV64_35390 [Ignavibacteriales bacterium]|nr:hypothetical protein [Ignavibacteriales bacterium]